MFLSVKKVGSTGAWLIVVLANEATPADTSVGSATGPYVPSLVIPKVTHVLTVAAGTVQVWVPSASGTSVTIF